MKLSDLEGVMGGPSEFWNNRYRTTSSLNCLIMPYGRQMMDSESRGDLSLPITGMGTSCRDYRSLPLHIFWSW